MPTHQILLICVSMIIAVAYIPVSIWMKKRYRSKKLLSTDIKICNLHNIGMRLTQQDSFCISDYQNLQLRKKKGIMAVLADGMGGLSNGAQLSAVITSSLLMAFDQEHAVLDENDFLDELLSSLYEQVDDFIAGCEEACGSTLLLVWIFNDHLHYRAIGDSRIYLVRNQQLLQINREHTYGQELDEAALQSGDWQTAVSDQRKAVTSYLGMSREELQVDRNAHFLQLYPKDIIALFSDGVFHTLQKDELLSSMNKIDPCEICDMLQKKIMNKQKQKQDNYTAIVLTYK